MPNQDKDKRTDMNIVLLLKSIGESWSGGKRMVLDCLGGGVDVEVHFLVEADVVHGGVDPIVFLWVYWPGFTLALTHLQSEGLVLVGEEVL